MTDRDLTPDEARAEVEAFMGGGWTAAPSKYHDGTPYIEVGNGHTEVWGDGPTYRAAVSALKAAWRDAARPWARSAYSCGWSAANGGCDRDNMDHDIARVLKEASK